METVIQETLELANIQARKLDSRIKLVIAPGLPLMMGDSVMLEQLLLNLLKNAMEACASSNIPMEERTIELHADPWEKNPERLQFQVVDHGPGIPEESRSKLLTPSIPQNPKAWAWDSISAALLPNFTAESCAWIRRRAGGPPSPSLSRSSKKLADPRHPLLKIANNKD